MCSGICYFWRMSNKHLRPATWLTIFAILPALATASLGNAVASTPAPMAIKKSHLLLASTTSTKSAASQVPQPSASSTAGLSKAELQWLNQQTKAFAGKVCLDGISKASRAITKQEGSIDKAFAKYWKIMLAAGPQASPELAGKVKVNHKTRRQPPQGLMHAVFNNGTEMFSTLVAEVASTKPVALSVYQCRLKAAKSD